MNLYLISQTANHEYDTYDSAVVAAETEDAAKRIHPAGDGMKIPQGDVWEARTWVNDPSLVTAKLIGIAVDGTKEGVIIASYNGG